ncbi:MAG TPA: hypothetical protein VK619_13910, partial [Pyrinomonadaceae bacterium]|nr:hypothetical protein [Pyrinomonadaceae bacterium]
MANSPGNRYDPNITQLPDGLKRISVTSDSIEARLLYLNRQVMCARPPEAISMFFTYGAKQQAEAGAGLYATAV